MNPSFSYQPSYRVLGSPEFAEALAKLVSVTDSPGFTKIRVLFIIYYYSILLIIIY